MQTRLETPNERHNYQSLEFPFSVFPHADLSGSIPGCVLRGGAFDTASLPSPPLPPSLSQRLSPCLETSFFVVLRLWLRLCPAPVTF